MTVPVAEAVEQRPRGELLRYQVESGRAEGSFSQCIGRRSQTAAAFLLSRVHSMVLDVLPCANIGGTRRWAAGAAGRHGSVSGSLTLKHAVIGQAWRRNQDYAAARTCTHGYVFSKYNK